MVPLPAAADLRRPERLVVLGNGYLSLSVTWVSSAWSRVGRGAMKVSPHLLYHPGSSSPLSPGSPHVFQLCSWLFLSPQPVGQQLAGFLLTSHSLFLPFFC